MENLSKSLEKGEMKNLEYTFVTRDGREFPAELSVGVIRDSSGIPTGFVAITKDITERKRVEDALRKSESKYRTLLENVPQKIFSKDRDLVYVSCNGNYARDLGIRPNEIAGKTDYDFYPRELAEKYRADDKRVLESGKVEDIEEEYVQNGQKVFVQTVKTPVKDENGNVVGVIGIFWDITEHRLMEQKYSTIVKTALDGFWINDSKGRLIAVNDAYCEMIGYTREELLSMSIRDIEASEKPEETAEHVKEIMKEGSDRFETRQRRKDGTVIDVEVSTTYYPAGKGQLVAFLRDVTDRKRMEDALAYERDLLYALMDNIPDSIYYKDTASRFTRINKALADLLGIKNTEEALGKTDFDFFTEEHARDAYSDEQKIMETRRPLINKIEKSERPDGYFLWSSTTKVPIKDKKDQITGIVGISRDITERKNMEAQLKEYSEQLEKKVEERTSQLEDAQEQLLKAARMATIGEVTAMVGHDLRNPLQVVVNTLYIAKKRTASLPPAEKESLTELHKTIAEQLTYMNKIVSDLQDYARPIVPQLVSTSLPQLITSTLSTLTVPDNVKVSILIPEDFPEMMFDPDLMRRVFTNLITNALQAMPEGGQLTINTCFDNEAMFISVEDTGVGIPKENLDKMFKPLFTTKSKGQGFGLPVCKRIVEAHGGSIMLESQVGKGSTFTVKMPKREVR
jgi:PAS domain S-box-containing protein